jgi:hypothetical protein
MHRLIALILLIPSLAHAEVSGCNSDGAKNAIIEEHYKSIKTVAAGLFQDAKPGSPAASMITELSRWEVKIENVRQIRYDATNNVRYCEAELIHTNYPEMALMTLAITGRIKPTCRRSVIYKIEFLLDKNADWITSDCQD